MALGGSWGESAAIVAAPDGRRQSRALNAAAGGCRTSNLATSVNFTQRQRPAVVWLRHWDEFSAS